MYGMCESQRKARLYKDRRIRKEEAKEVKREMKGKGFLLKLWMLCNKRNSA